MIKIVIFDFDGVFTNNFVFFDNESNINKYYNIKDGTGIKLLKDKNIKIGVISGYKENKSQFSILKHLNIDYISLGNNKKLDVLKKWCIEYNFNLHEVAYMGDDINDLEIMSAVKLTGCPKDANKECLKICQFISTKNGGDGCIREFSEYICEIVNRCNSQVTALIPCRKGSQRCREKNLRKFADTTLLQNKIDILKKCKKVDNILVSTNDDNAIEIAKQNNISFYKRDDSLCVGDVSSEKVHINLASSITTEIFLYNTPVTPFINCETIDDIIDYWRYHPEYEIVFAGKQIKSHIWKNNKPNNFEINKGIIGTQEINDGSKISCADCGLVGYKKYIIEKKCLFGDGKKNYVYGIDDLEAFDIDWNLDFVISECLFHKSFKNIKLIDNYMKNYEFNETKILDCTIRDTGYLNNWSWSYETVKDFVYYMGEIGVEYCEIGFFKDKKYVEENAGIWRNLGENIDIINKIKLETKTKTKIAIMMDLGSIDEEYYDVDNLDDQNITNIDLIRVFSFFSILDKSIPVCNKLKQKGYTVSLNIGHCAHLENDEMQKIINMIKNKDIKIDYLYFADSLGMLTPNEIDKFLINFKDIYPVKNGFHNHNNNGTVFGNLINLINCKIDILDGTISGFGKNGGNANLEQLIMYLCIKYNYNLKLEPLLIFLDKIKNIDFGENDKINMTEMKTMLQQFMNIHSSYLKPIINKSLLDIYNELSQLENKKKTW